MPRTPEQFERIREEKQQQIMDAALELFAEEGYHSASISKIALRAGISKGLMYNYFSSKQELLTAIFDKGMHALFKLFDPDKNGILTSDEFNFFVDSVFETLKENTQYWKLYFSVIMQPGIFEMIGKRYEKLLKDSLQLLYNYYEEQGVDDPMSEAMLFGAIMDGISMNYLLNPGMFPLEDIKQKIIDKFGHKPVIEH
jgi:AcrR family transcriptional regulator